MLTSNRFKMWIKIDGIPSNYQSLPFGRQLDYRGVLADFQKTAKRVWVSIKRKSAAAALREFKSLYRPTQFYAVFSDSRDYRDDSIEVYYTE